MAEAQPSGFTLQEYFTPGARRRLSRLPRLVRSAVAIVWAADRRNLLLCASLQLFIGATLAVQLLLIRGLLSELLGAGSPTFAAVRGELIALALIGAGASAAGVVLGIRQRLLGQRVSLHANEGVIRTATGVPLITYDEPGFHDHLQRAQLSASSRPALMVNALLGFAGASLAIGGIIVALLVVEPLFLALVVAAFAPAWLVTNHTGRLIYRHTVEQTERSRRRLYLFELLTTKPTAQEIRAFDLGGFLGRRQWQLQAGLIDELSAALHRRIGAMVGAAAVTALLTTGALALLVYFVTSGRMSTADAGTAAGAMILLAGRLRGLVGDASGLYEHSLYLEDYSTFVAAAPRIEAARATEQPPGPPQTVAADGLRFTYPSRTEPSLVDASLTLSRGEVVALVGENGSGKTTFAKLLAGLYAPEAGTVSWDGLDAARFEPAAVRGQVAVIFQDFIRYQLSVHDNIAMGDHHRYDDRAAVERAARAAGIHGAIAALPDGYDTLLGPEYYGGSDLSGGQWQRIGLARAFFRDAPIVILDEPTAALDPRAEAQLFASMRELFAGRAVLLISHRFGSVRTADRIYVLRDGRVHESGAHQELMAAGGYYAELFRMQADLYVD